MSICYRDMIFCPFYEDCADAKECHRPLTPEVRKKAKQWWGREGAPIDQYMSKPGCHITVDK